MLVVILMLGAALAATLPDPDASVVHVYRDALKAHSLHVAAHSTLLLRFEEASRVRTSGGYDSGEREAGELVPVGVGDDREVMLLAGSSQLRLVVQPLRRTRQQAGPVVEVLVGSPSGVGARFSPSVAVVQVGTTVRWVFETFGHTVTQSNGSSCDTLAGGFESGFLQQDATFEYTFEAEGVFNYHCRAHCSSLGMRGTVVVQGEPEHIVEHLVDSFSPSVLEIQSGDEVCFDFVVAGSVTQGTQWSTCAPAPGGFQSGSQVVGARHCRVFDEPAGTSFPYFSATCFYGIIVVADAPAVTVTGGSFTPRFLSVPLNTRVVWTIAEPGHSITQALSEDTLGACEVQNGGFDSGVTLVANQEFSHVFDQVGVFPYLDAPHCPRGEYWGRVTVFDPFAAPTDAPPSVTEVPSLDPCRCIKPEGMQLNFHFGDGMLAGHQPACPSVLFGRVVEEGVGGLPSVTVLVRDSSGALSSAITDASGFWQLAGVVPGVTRVAVDRASLPGPSSNWTHTAGPQDPRIINVPAGVRVDEGTDTFSRI